MGYTVEEEYQYGRPLRETVAGAEADLGTDMGCPSTSQSTMSHRLNPSSQAEQGPWEQR